MDVFRATKRLFLIAFFATLFPTLASGQVDEDVANEYEKWIGRYRNVLIHPGSRSTSEITTEVPIAVITIVTEASGNEVIPNQGPFVRGFVVKGNGEVEFFARGILGHKGGCCGKMSAEETARAKEILANLPPDGKRLPPNHRRLIIQSPVNASLKVGLYDLAFLPDLIAELLRITQTDIGTHVPSFEPLTTVNQTGRSEANGLLIIGDDQSLATAGGSAARRAMGNGRASEQKDEVRLPQNAFLQAGAELSPDESTLIAGGWGHITFFDTRDWRVVKRIEAPLGDREFPDYRKFRFIERSKYLLFDGNVFGSLVIENRSWRKVKKPETIPDDALFYSDAPDGTRAVYRLANKIFFRGDRGTTMLLELGEDKLENASFAPNSQQVVLVTAGKYSRGDSSRWRTRMRVWDANANLIHELRPLENDMCEAVYGLRWTADERYIIAATRSGNFLSKTSIGIWDARSGRHVGDLNGCVGALIGMRILSGEEKIVAGCSDGTIRTWDLASALREIEQFRNSAPSSMQD